MELGGAGDTSDPPDERKTRIKKWQEEEASVSLRSPYFLSPICTVRSCDGPSGGVETGLAHCSGCFHTSEEASAPAPASLLHLPPPLDLLHVQQLCDSPQAGLAGARLPRKSPGLAGQTWDGRRRRRWRQTSLRCSPAHQDVCLSQ